VPNAAVERRKAQLPQWDQIWGWDLFAEELEHIVIGLLGPECLALP